jgi:uncharacterized integral membrane protein
MVSLKLKETKYSKDNMKNENWILTKWVLKRILIGLLLFYFNGYLMTLDFNPLNWFIFTEYELRIVMLLLSQIVMGGLIWEAKQSKTNILSKEALKKINKQK